MPIERTPRQMLDTYIIRRGDDTTAINPVGWREAMAALDAIEIEAVAAERARIRAAVEGLRVRANVRHETPWQEGFRQSRNETVAAVLALIEP